MAYNFASLIFTSAIKALREKYGSRRQYDRREGSGTEEYKVGPQEAEFLAERDRFYADLRRGSRNSINIMASSNASIQIKASDWNCPQHITPRFTENEIRDALAPWTERIEALEKENKALRVQFHLPEGSGLIGAGRSS